MVFKRSLIFMAAILLTFSTMSYAESKSNVRVYNAMTKGHQGQQAGHMAAHMGGGGKAGYPSGAHASRTGAGHHGWKYSLDKKQREQVESMHLELSRSMAPLKAELAFRKAELKNLVTVDEPNTAAIKAKIKKITSIKSKIMWNKYSYTVKMRKVLTPSQRRSFDIEFISNAEHWQGHYKGK